MVRDVNGVELQVGDLVERVDMDGGFPAFRRGTRRRITEIHQADGLLFFNGPGGGQLFGRRVRKVIEDAAPPPRPIAEAVWVQATAENVVVGSRVRRKARPDIPDQNQRSYLREFPEGAVTTVVNIADAQRLDWVRVDINVRAVDPKLAIWLSNLDVDIAVAQPVAAPVVAKWAPGAKVRRIQHADNCGVIRHWPIGAEGVLMRRHLHNKWRVTIIDAVAGREHSDYVFYQHEMELVGGADDVIRAGDKVIRTDNRSVYFDQHCEYVVQSVRQHDGYLGIKSRKAGIRWISPSGFVKATAGAKPVEPPKPVIDMDKVVEVVKAKVDTHKGGGAATYGYIDNEYVFDDDMNHACHAGLNKMYGNPKFGADKVAAVNWLYSSSFTMADMRVLFNYITDPEQSPYRAMLDGAIAVEGKTQFALAITDLSWSGPHIASLFKTFRIFTEAARAPSARLFLRMVAEGVHPGVALFMSQHWTDTVSPCRGAHGLFFDTSSAKTLDLFVHGRIPDKGKSWVERPAYAGVDTLWPCGDDSYEEYINEQYKNLITPAKKVEGAFAKNITVGGLTVETLIKIAKLESDRLGLSDQ